jgi:hypothetical protein
MKVSPNVFKVFCQTAGIYSRPYETILLFSQMYVSQQNLVKKGEKYVIGKLCPPPEILK